MARRRGQGPRRPIKGFRPGKEPPQLRKQRAKQQFGKMSGTQERLVDMFAERTPQESRRLIRAWRIGFLAGAIALAAIGGALFVWSIIAGAVLEAFAIVLFFLWWRLHRQREALEAMADAVSGTGPGKKDRRKKR